MLLGLVVTVGERGFEIPHPANLEKSAAALKAMLSTS